MAEIENEKKGMAAVAFLGILFSFIKKFWKCSVPNVKNPFQNKNSAMCHICQFYHLGETVPE